MNIPKKCDVVVIGGGPSGSLASTFLSQKGYDVVLLERKKHPRPHVGENILPHFWKYCDMAQVSDKIAAEGFVQKAGGTTVWNGLIRQMSFRDFGFTRPGFHIERDRFDHILLENARTQGAQVFERVSVLSVELQDEGEQQGVTYRYLNSQNKHKISCRFVVDATGQRALIAKQLGMRVYDDHFRFMSIWAYFKNSKYIALGGKAYSAEHRHTIPPTTFVSSIAESGGWGWAWHIPLRERTSVGLVVPIELMKAVKLGSGGGTNGESWQAYFLRKCRETPYLNKLLEDAQFCEGSLGKIHDYSYRSTQLAGSGFFLIGDAAGFVDPIFSAGITIGMYSAYMAAWAIDRCFKDMSSVAHYQALFTSQLQGRLEVARSLSLPGYQLGNRTSEVAKSAIQFESLLEQQLMDTASKLTTRAHNFSNLVTNENGQPSEKVVELEELAF